MATTITGNDCVDAWKNASRHVLNHGRSDYNVITTIDHPEIFDDNWIDLYNPKSVRTSYNSIKNVLWAIFPYKLYRRVSDKDTLYSRYPDMHRRFKKIRHIHGPWERSYFLRMIAFGESRVNQIDRIITAIASSNRNYKAAFNIHLSSSEYDNNVQRIGAPCLQYIQLSLTDDSRIHMVAVYRNHDYLNKALANFIGLSQLLMFICAETGRASGTLVCHSIHAYSDSHQDLQTLIDRN